MGSTASPDSDIFQHDTPHLRATYDRKDPGTIMMMSGMTRVLSDLRCDHPGGTTHRGAHRGGRRGIAQLVMTRCPGPDRPRGTAWVTG